MAKRKVAKRKTVKKAVSRKTSKSVFEAHPNLSWLLPLLALALILSALVK